MLNYQRVNHFNKNHQNTRVLPGGSCQGLLEARAASHGAGAPGGASAGGGLAPCGFAGGVPRGGAGTGNGGGEGRSQT